MRMPHWQPIISAGSYAPQRNSLSSRQPALTHKTYPDPSRPTLDDLDPESVTPDRRVARVRSHRERADYPTAEPLLGNLLVVWRALCDPVFSGHATALDTAYPWAPVIDAVENYHGKPQLPRPTHTNDTA